MARMNAGRHEVIPGTLRRGFAKNRRLDLDEALLRHKSTHQRQHAASEHQIVLYIGPAQIEITVFQPYLIVGLAVFLNLKRRCLGLRQNPQLLRNDLNVSGLQILVDGSRAFLYDARHGDDVLAAKRLRFLKACRTDLRLIKHELQNPASIAQINKDQAPQISSLLHPAHDGHILADIGV